MEVLTYTAMVQIPLMNTKISLNIFRFKIPKLVRRRKFHDLGLRISRNVCHPTGAHAV
jgi:hypothetical protein